MDINQQKEQFSNAFMQAIAAVAGFALSKPSVDNDSIDWVFSGSGNQQTSKRPRLEIQLKCTSNSQSLESEISFPLKVKNYNDLRVEELLVPRILIVVLVPEDISSWLAQTDEQMTLKKCGYWLDLRGSSETSNVETVTVHIPIAQRFTSEALTELMRQINEKGRLER